MQTDTNRRGSDRWLTEINVTVKCGNVLHDANILNMNMGGCFIEGHLQAQVGDMVYLTSLHNTQINELPGLVVWVVYEEGLTGVGVRFENVNEEAQKILLSWYNSLARG